MSKIHLVLQMIFLRISTLFSFILFLTISFTGFAVNVNAAEWDLDPTFGNGGIVITSPDGSNSFGAGRVVMQSDGKIVLASSKIVLPGDRDFLAVRFNADGSLDTSFGTNGIATVSVGSVNDFANSVAIQPDGKIVLAGSRAVGNSTVNALARLNADGSIDTSFGTNGSLTVPFSDVSGNYPTSIDEVRIDNSGKTVFCGYALGLSLRYRMIIGRLNENGSLDNTFGTGGKVFTADGTCQDMAIVSDNSIVIAGFNSVQFSTSQVVVKHNNLGVQQWSYVRGELAVIGRINGMAVQPDGKLVFVGHYNYKKNIFRMTANGSLDSTFLNQPNPTDGEFYNVIVQSDGKIITNFTNDVLTLGNFSTVRFNPNGTADTTFGTGGTVTTTVSTGQERGVGLLLQPDGKYLFTGYAYVNSNLLVAMVRYKGLTSVQPLKTRFDFDGDGRADLGVVRPSSYIWYQLLGSNYNFNWTAYGTSGDILTPADYDGDGKTDISIFRPSTGQWVYGTQQFVVGWGQAGDVPLPSDVDGDGKADFVVFRPSDRTWYRLTNGGGVYTFAAFGAVGDQPVIGDFDGDGKADPAVFRPSTGEWFYAASSQNGVHLRAALWGLAGDKLVPADYDGDGKTDAAIFRNGLWAINNSSNGSNTILTFGQSGDKPIAADYDGDGKADVGVYRPSDGTWYLLRSTSGFQALTFGASTDIPLQNAFVQ